MNTAINHISVDCRDAFATEMDVMGLGLSDLPIDDGQLHRFHVEGDKSRSENGWYVLYGDGIPAGSFGTWKTGEKHNWSAKRQQEMSSAELEAHRKRIEAAATKPPS